jgi:hypothetical protein
MAVSYAVALAYNTNKMGLKLLGPLGLVFVVGCQLFSLSKNLGDKEPARVAEQSLTAVSRAIKSNGPATILSSPGSASINFCQLLALSESVDPQTKFLWLNEKKSMPLTPTTNMYAFNPDDQLFKDLQKMGLRLAPVDKMSYFFKVAKDELR